MGDTGPTGATGDTGVSGATAGIDTEVTTTPSTLSVVPSSLDPFVIDERALQFRVACVGTTSCMASAAASISLPGTGRIEQFSNRTVTLNGQQWRTIKLADPPSLRATLRTYLRHHAGTRLTVNLTVTATVTDGTTTTQTRTFRVLTRPGLK
jgi:hypothetical protein